MRRGHTTVFTSLDLDVPQGRLVGLLGPSGSGKSTLMRVFLGLQAGVRGTVTVLGHPAGDRVLATEVAYASQQAAVYDDLTVAQNISYFSSALGVEKSRGREVLADVWLASYRRRLVGSLSGGQRNRVALAVAMLGSPRLLVLDEPTVGLDPVLRRDLWAIFRHLADRGSTVIVSSHVMDEALRCDELILLHEGQLLAQLTPGQLLESTESTDPDTAFLKVVESHGRGRDAVPDQDPTGRDNS